jgi:hypothetical protein
VISRIWAQNLPLMPMKLFNLILSQIRGLKKRGQTAFHTVDVDDFVCLFFRGWPPSKGGWLGNSLLSLSPPTYVCNCPLKRVVLSSRWDAHRSRERLVSQPFISGKDHHARQVFSRAAFLGHRPGSNPQPIELCADIGQVHLMPI